MDCLVNRIGVMGCDPPTSAAITADPSAIPPVLAQPALPILLINQLPGVTLTNIAALADGERETFLDVWDAIAFRAIKKFEVLLRAKVSTTLCIYNQAIVECLMCENASLFDVALWYLHGTELMIERTSTDALNRYTTIDLQKAETLKGEFFAEFQSAFDDAALAMSTKESLCVPHMPEQPREALNWVFGI